MTLELYIVGATGDTTMTVTSEGAMSIETFSQWAGIGRSLVYKEIAVGRLRVKKVGRRTLVTRDAAETWLAELPDGTRQETRFRMKRNASVATGQLAVPAG